MSGCLCVVVLKHVAAKHFTIYSGILPYLSQFTLEFCHFVVSLTLTIYSRILSYLSYNLQWNLVMSLAYSLKWDFVVSLLQFCH